MAVRGTVSVGLALILLSGCSDAPVYDTVLLGGTVVDGTGAPAFVADVAMDDGRIAAIGPDLGARGGEVIDVSGLIVSPGFWDNHAHLVTLAEYPDAENFIRQGITTVLAPLHSQPQPWPLDAYMDDVRMALNVGMFAGHTWIRERVIGLENRPPTDPELEWMRALVDSTMQQGALGLSTGLEYVPAAYAEPDEVVALAEVAARYGGIYVTHMRDEGVRVIDAVQETLEVGRRAGIPVQINHHKVTGAANWGTTSRTLALLDSASAAGQEVVHDVYPYTAFSTYSDLLFPAWVLADGPEAFAARVADPAVRARLVSEMRTIYGQQTGPGPESVQFRTLDGRPDMTGRTLADYLVDAGRPTTLDETIELLIELQLNGRFIGNFYGMDEADVIRIMQHPTSMFETDGDLVQPGVGFPHPRTYGSYPRILGRYVRELGVLTLEEAVRKMTSAPAEWLGQSDRGRLGVGMVADITVFDADRITDRSQYTDPHHYSEGVVYVWVGGTAVLRAEEMTGARPGRFLERGRR
ncbi:MAG: N-acyl-D-amino-acid deacylase family protein [Longimicrobiales bacterium]